MQLYPVRRMRSSLLLCSLLIVSCASWTPPRNTKEEQKRFDNYEERMGASYDGTLRAASRINVRKPIGEFEAWALSNAYFYTVFGLCGGVERITDRGTVWVASGAVGIAGGPHRSSMWTRLLVPPGRKDARESPILVSMRKRSNQTMQRSSPRSDA